MLQIVNGKLNTTPEWNVKKIYEEVLSLETYTYSSYYDNELEKDCTYFYPFQKFFLQQTLLANKLLSHNSFATQYEAHHTKILNETYIQVHNKNYSGEGLKSHIQRTYPSLIRDFHFYYLLIESGQFKEVKYCYDLDTKQKIDIALITQDDKQINLRLFVDTPKSKFYYEQKNNAKDKSTFDLPLRFGEAFKTPNGYYLYTRKHVKMILNENATHVNTSASTK